MDRVRVRAWVGTIVFLVLAPGRGGRADPVADHRVADPVDRRRIWPVAIVAAVVILSGIVVLLDAFIRFARADGTPAPPVPTAHLVVVGPYRYVRNPMYLAVLAIILGQALLFGSWATLLYAGVVFSRWRCSCGATRSRRWSTSTATSTGSTGGTSGGGSRGCGRGRRRRPLCG